MEKSRYVAVIGAGEATPREYQLAYEVGEILGRKGHILVCGGLGGVMEAAAKGANAVNGTSIGILPTDDRAPANPYLTVTIPTGFSHGRNYLVVKAGDGVIAVGGAAGTLSEVGLALKLGRPLVLLESLDIEAAGLSAAKTKIARDAGEAVEFLEGFR